VRLLLEHLDERSLELGEFVSLGSPRLAESIEDLFRASVLGLGHRLETRADGRYRFELAAAPLGDRLEKRLRPLTHFTLNARVLRCELLELLPARFPKCTERFKKRP